MAPINYWNKKENRINYLNDLYKYMNYNNIEDWYKINRYNIINYYGSGLLKKYKGNYYNLIIDNIEYNWDIKKFKKYGFSLISIEWLEYRMIVDNTYIVHKLNNDCEFKIPDTRYLVDGYSKDSNTCYEFLGDYWHGNFKKYNSNIYNRHNKKTMNELNIATNDRINRIKELGYNIIYIWESDWIKAKKSVIIIQKKFRNRIINICPN